MLIVFLFWMDLEKMKREVLVETWNLNFSTVEGCISSGIVHYIKSNAIERETCEATHFT